MQPTRRTSGATNVSVLKPRLSPTQPALTQLVLLHVQGNHNTTALPPDSGYQGKIRPTKIKSDQSRLTKLGTADLPHLPARKLQNALHLNTYLKPQVSNNHQRELGTGARHQ